jgi:hypothetical protein
LRDRHVVWGRRDVAKDAESDGDRGVAKPFLNDPRVDCLLEFGRSAKHRPLTPPAQDIRTHSCRTDSEYSYGSQTGVALASAVTPVIHTDHT